jgi:hypothetical protein
MRTVGIFGINDCERRVCIIYIGIFIVRISLQSPICTVFVLIIFLSKCKKLYVIVYHQLNLTSYCFIKFLKIKEYSLLH